MGSHQTRPLPLYSCLCNFLSEFLLNLTKLGQINRRINPKLYVVQYTDQIMPDHTWDMAFFLSSKVRSNILCRFSLVRLGWGMSCPGYHATLYFNLYSFRTKFLFISDKIGQDYWRIYQKNTTRNVQISWSPLRQSFNSNLFTFSNFSFWRCRIIGASLLCLAIFLGPLRLNSNISPFVLTTFIQEYATNSSQNARNFQICLQFLHHVLAERETKARQNPARSTNWIRRLHPVLHLHNLCAAFSQSPSPIIFSIYFFYFLFGCYLDVIRPIYLHIINFRPFP